MPQTEYREESRRAKVVVTDGVQVKKKSVGKKFADFFFEDMTPGEIAKMFVYEQLFPAIKDGIHDILSDLTDTMFYGRPRAKSGSKHRSGSYTSYGSYSNSSRPESRERRSNSYRVANDFDDITFDSREKACRVLDELLELLSKFKEVSIGDFYDAAGITRNGYSDQSWGWTDLHEAYVTVRHKRWMIVLPPVVELK